MDNVTHTLYGVALARTGLNRLAPRATATLIIGANFPDIDIASFFGGSISYLKYHRGITHSLLGIPLEGLLVATVMYFIHNRRVKKDESALWWKYFLLASAGVGSHVLLDFTNSYGLRLFLPFVRDWYSGDIEFIIDPWVLAVLFVALGLPSFFGLINQEIGIKNHEHRTSAFVCLIILLLYWGAKGLSHHQVLADLAQAEDLGEPIMRVGVVPQPLNPFRWYGIIETRSSYRVVERGWDPFDFSLGTQRDRIFHKAEEGPVLEAVRRGPQARMYLSFARYPVFTIIPRNQGYTVTIQDLRFEPITSRRRAFLFMVELDKELHTSSETFNF